MNKLSILILSIIFIAACNSQHKDVNKVIITSTDEYELHHIPESKSTLVLFPGAGSTSVQTKEEFEILPMAAKNRISVLLMNINKHLWLDESQTEGLADLIESIFTENNIDPNNVYVGGMSIGGNMSLTISNYMCENSGSQCPKGVFIIDSPIDLFELYSNALVDVGNEDHSTERLSEPKWIVNYFEQKLGATDLQESTSKVSPFTLRFGTNNVPKLQNNKLRFYTEPDKEWWLKNRQTQFKNTNAYTIQSLYNQLKRQGWKNISLIETRDRGYRANGERHPHSWSIVDVEELISWMQE